MQTSPLWTLSLWFLSAVMVTFVSIGFLGFYQKLENKFSTLTPASIWICTAFSIPIFIGLLGLISVKLSAFVFFIIFVLCTRDGLKKLKFILTQLKPETKSEKMTYALFVSIPLLYFFIKILDGATILPHGDPLTYHLLGPLFWVKVGRIHFTIETHMGAVCNFFEMYALLALQWTHWIFEFLFKTLQRAPSLDATFYARMSSQIFTQWLSMTLAFSSALVIFYWILQSLIYSLDSDKVKNDFDQIPTYLLFSLIWLVALAPQTEWLVIIAKNNWLALCFSMIAFLGFSANPKTRVPPILVGVALASGYWSKATNITLLVPLGFALGFYYLWRSIQKNSSSKSTLLQYAFGIVLASLVFLIRNYLWTENPFYPGEGGLIHSPQLSDSERYDLRNYFSPFQFPPREIFWTQFKEFLFPIFLETKSYALSATLFSIIGIVGILFFIIQYLKKRKLFIAGLSTLFIPLSIYWLGIIIGPRFWEPHFQTFLMSVRLMALAFILNFIRPKNMNYAFGFAILCLFSVNLPIHILWKDILPIITGKTSAKEMVYTIPYGRIYECLNEKIPLDAKVINDGLDSLYYITKEIQVLTLHPELDAPLRKITGFKNQLAYLKAQGFTHAWLNTPCAPDVPRPYCTVLGDYREEVKTLPILCSQLGGVVLAL